MYHYVREYSEKLPKLQFLAASDFCKQLDYFEGKFGFVRYEEWDQFIENGKMPEREGKVLLTFDDATSCHYHFVYPELKRRGLWASFFVPTLPFSSNEMLNVHKIHMLCATVPGIQLLDAARLVIKSSDLRMKGEYDFNKITYMGQENDEGITEFKRLINYFVDFECQSYLLGEIADACSFRFPGSTYYISKEQMLEMSRSGFTIGSHTHDHPLMSSITKKVQHEQITLSFDILSNLGVLREKVYCHPYGGAHSFNSNTTELLQAMGAKYSWSVNPREIQSTDIYQNRFALPRFDCNLFPNGKVFEKTLG